MDNGPWTRRQPALWHRSTMRPPAFHMRPASPRRGFTMIELLIVLTIIAILLSISFVVYGAAVESARVEATRATIRQLDSALQERYDAFRRVNLKSQAQLFKLRYDAATPPNTPATIPLEIAEIIVRKDRYRAAFPQRFEDLWGFDGVPNGGPPNDDAHLWRVYCQMTGNPPGSPPAPRDTTLESSELLYLSLTNGGAFSAPVLPLDRLRASHVRDADGNGLNEIYDEWGNPLRFFNWPTRLVRKAGETSPGPPIDFGDILVADLRNEAYPLVPSLPKTTVDVAYDFANFVNHPLSIDPDDPTGALIAAQNATNVCRASFVLGNVPNQQPVDENFYHTFDTFHTPLIVSAGPDGKLGLEEPSQPGADPQRLAQPSGTLDELFDNITNRQP